MASSALRLDPPAIDAPIAADTGLHSQAWTQHHQDVADRLVALPVELTTGVVDGSDAAAGKIGEYLEATFGPVSLTHNVSADLGSMPLGAGDWEVWGNVAFTASAFDMQGAQAWVSTVAATPPAGLGRASVLLANTTTMMTSGTQLPTGTRRVSQAAAGTAYLGAYSYFSGGGTVTVSGTLAARRVR